MLCATVCCYSYGHLLPKEVIEFIIVDERLDHFIILGSSDRNSPAFWHSFLPPEHDHVNKPSIKHPKYYDTLKYTNLFLITIKIDNRYGDGWNEILFDDRFGDSGTSSYNIVAMASDRGGSACDFYSFQVR